jgi:hypothetical protein
MPKDKIGSGIAPPSLVHRKPAYPDSALKPTTVEPSPETPLAEP